MRNKPYTAAELFDTIIDRLKKQSLIPDSLDYICRTRDHYEIRTYEINIGNNLDFGGNEGIYLHLNIRVHEDGKMVTHDLGTIKTLGRTRSDMEIMAKLLADFICEAVEFIDDNLNDFTWQGCNVRPIMKDGRKSMISIDYMSREKAHEERDRVLSGADERYSGVIVTDYVTRTEETYEIEACKIA